MIKQENRFILVKLDQAGSGMAVGAGVPIQNMFVHTDHQPGNSASGTLSGNILNSLVINQQSGKQKQIAKSKHLMTWVDNKDFKHQRDIKIMDENQAPLTAQSRSTDLFSASNSEILNTTQASSLCGVSYHKFLREFGEIPYSFVYPGGPRIYMRSEVRAFIEGKNK